MKLPFDRDYFKISLYAVSAAISVCLAVFVMAKSAEICRGIWNFVRMSFELAAPLIIGIVIAFLLDPLAEFYEKRLKFGSKKHGKRYWGAAASFLTVVCATVLLVTAVSRSVGAADISGISSGINRAAGEFLLKVDNLQYNLSHMGVLSFLNGAVNSLMNYISALLGRFAAGFASSVTSAGAMAVKIGIGAASAFYFLLEKERMIFRLKDLAYTFLPGKAADGIIVFFRDISTVFSGYVTGQLTDALIMAVLFSVCFYMAGIKYAFVIGIISGFFNLIPYIGAVAAFILSSVTAFISGTPMKALYAALTVIVVQQIDSVIISPRVVGRSVKLHPVLVILSLSVFGNLFGLWGMLLAVPVTAIIKLYFDRFYNYKKKKNSLPLTQKKNEI